MEASDFILKCFSRDVSYKSTAYCKIEGFL